ncbi:MAG: PIG-L family deacetylase [Anaerolineae bacterium]|jgi:LmbE family N-acetylglucosaminyl deacetylase|nr:PIG-L family deacetylase [Anaerolineae bacterium]MDH7472553.1 PIG-L family deacetylase [Anaerolineae bacterium]
MPETTTQTNAFKRVLAIMAHPDDADLTCAGTLAKWIKAGWEVQYVVCTCGDKGTKDPAITPQQLAAIREEEQLAAARVLGVKDVIFLRHKDGELEATKGFRAEIAMLIRHHKPDIVITHDPWRPYQLHPDHRAVGITVCDAIVSARDHLFLPAQTAIGLEPFEPAALYLWVPAEADQVEDITETMDLKLEVIAQHKSQMRNPDWQERIRQWAADTGAPYGLTYAEAFKVIPLRT